MTSLPAIFLAEQWYSDGQKPDDDEAGDVYKARLKYPSRTLGPNDSATYRQIAFFGPKERDVLSAAAGGWPKLGDLINLGTFSFVGKYLVAIITWIHDHVTLGNWGLAIIVVTICLRIFLFPLTWKQIQSTIAMRKLKPEIDALNDKFKDDAQAKNLAMMELWRKHKVNPLGGWYPRSCRCPSGLPCTRRCKPRSNFTTRGSSGLPTCRRPTSISSFPSCSARR